MNAKILITVLFISGLPACLFAQKVTTVTIDGIKYAAISSEGMPKGYETRNITVGHSNSLYYSTPLYTYSETGETAPENAEPGDPKYSWPVYDTNGEHLQVKKIVRHDVRRKGSYSFPDNTGNGVYSEYNPDIKISTLFAIAPTDIYDDGATTSGNGNSPKMHWATAAGFLVSAHTLNINVRSSATQRSCYMYKGKNGNDPCGTWRLPTHRELILMCILKYPLRNSSDETGFTAFYSEKYWSASESYSGGGSKSGYNVEFSDKINAGADWATVRLRVRCIRDIIK